MSSEPSSSFSAPRRRATPRSACSRSVMSLKTTATPVPQPSRFSRRSADRETTGSCSGALRRWVRNTSSVTGLPVSATRRRRCPTASASAATSTSSRGTPPGPARVPATRPTTSGCWLVRTIRRSASYSTSPISVCRNSARTSASSRSRSAAVVSGTVRTRHWASEPPLSGSTSSRTSTARPPRSSSSAGPPEGSSPSPGSASNSANGLPISSLTPTPSNSSTAGVHASTVPRLSSTIAAASFLGRPATSATGFALVYLTPEHSGGLPSIQPAHMSHWHPEAGGSDAGRRVADRVGAGGRGCAGKACQTGVQLSPEHLLRRPRCRVP